MLITCIRAIPLKNGVVLAFWSISVTPIPAMIFSLLKTMFLSIFFQKQHFMAIKCHFDPLNTNVYRGMYTAIPNEDYLRDAY